ncbi:hypothetical protein, partial [Rathayibacter rathayi]|uniref:hypothetical protein n=1 Tax=Rathayibacter rathayi TaxID=33887 RepID=UPI001CA55A57
MPVFTGSFAYPDVGGAPYACAAVIVMSSRDSATPADPSARASALSATSHPHRHWSAKSVSSPRSVPGRSRSSSFAADDAS